MPSPLDDQLGAAARDTYDRTASVRAASTTLDLTLPPDAVQGIRDAIARAEHCEHLLNVPVQPAVVLLGLEPVAECFDCLTARTAPLQHCPSCGYPVVGGLNRVQVQVDQWLAVMFTCAVCWDTMNAGL